MQIIVDLWKKFRQRSILFQTLSLCGIGFLFLCTLLVLLGSYLLINGLLNGIKLKIFNNLSYGVIMQISCKNFDQDCEYIDYQRIPPGQYASLGVEPPTLGTGPAWMVRFVTMDKHVIGCLNLNYDEKYRKNNTVVISQAIFCK